MDTVSKIMHANNAKIEAALARLPERILADAQQGYVRWLFWLPEEWAQSAPFKLFRPLTWNDANPVGYGLVLVQALQKAGLEVTDCSIDRSASLRARVPGRSGKCKVYLESDIVEDLATHRFLGGNMGESTIKSTIKGTGKVIRRQQGLTFSELNCSVSEFYLLVKTDDRQIHAMRHGNGRVTIFVDLPLAQVNDTVEFEYDPGSLLLVDFKICSESFGEGAKWPHTEAKKEERPYPAPPPPPLTI